MTGVIAGLVGSVKAASVALTNLFANSSFESATPNKIALGTRTTGNAKTGNYSATNAYNIEEVYDSETGNLLYTRYRDNRLIISLDNYIVGQKYSISFWYTGPFCTLNVFGFAVFIPGGAYTYYKVENLTATVGGTLDFLANATFDSPNPYYLDDVWLVSGSTAY